MSMTSPIPEEKRTIQEVSLSRRYRKMMHWGDGREGG